MPQETVPTPESAPTQPVAPLEWDTPHHTFHAVRVLCDEAGLTLEEKNLICAVIMGESQFNNKALNENRNSQGVITSTDYGICQINSRFHIGEHNDFPSVQFVLENPGEAINWMIKMYKEGHINWWCAYANGSYKKWLNPISYIWISNLSN